MRVLAPGHHLGGEVAPLVAYHRHDASPGRKDGVQVREDEGPYLGGKAWRINGADVRRSFRSFRPTPFAQQGTRAGRLCVTLFFGLLVTLTLVGAALVVVVVVIVVVVVVVAGVHR
jgi:hypothetical protein